MSIFNKKHILPIFALAGLLTSPLVLASTYNAAGGGITLISNANNRGIYMVKPSKPDSKTDSCWHDSDFAKGAVDNISQQVIEQSNQCKIDNGTKAGQYLFAVYGDITGQVSFLFRAAPGQTCTVSFSIWHGGWSKNCQ